MCARSPGFAGAGETFIFSALMSTSYILRGAHDLGDGHMEINDPYGLRNGAVLKKFDHEIDVEKQPLAAV